MDARDVGLLDALCRKARCVTLADVHGGDRGPEVIGLRHDVDDHGWESCLALAEWEFARGRRSTYYFLHTAPYWGSPEFIEGVRRIAEMRHEVGLHNNAITVWYETGRDPFEVLVQAVTELRAWSGSPVRSTAGHGDSACYTGRFVNYTMFEECPAKGAAWLPFKEVTGLDPRPLADFGFDFAGDHVPRALYVSDSGGEWTHDLKTVGSLFPYASNVVILQHPDWYGSELFA